MSRYIDAEKIDFMNKCFGEKSWFARDLREAAQNLINAQPTADVQEVKHGKWIVDTDEGTAQCSACRAEFEDRGDTIPDYWGFCPKCGAKMDMKEEK